MVLLSVSSVMNTVLAVLLAILILLAMITVHEFGHYVAGKILKFKINEFAIGFGPKLFRRVSRKSGEAFSIRLLPLGGFCAFEGEDGEAENENAFNAKAPWKRIIVLVAGPLMNYILAVLLIMVSLFAFGQMLFKINGVAPADETYSEYSLCVGDLITSVNGREIYLTTDLMSALKGCTEGEIIDAEVLRGVEEKQIKIKVRSDCDFKNSEETAKIWRALGVGTHEGADGVSYWSVGVESVRFGFFSTVGRSFEYSMRIAGTIFKVVGELLTGNLSLSSMGGPVTTVKLTSEIASQSIQNFFEISAYIGVNLAVFNLLPIPALDGSKVIFCLIEMIFRKPVPRKVEAVIHAVGFIMILAFAVLVDILQFTRC